MWFFEICVTHLLGRKYQNRYWVGITETWYTSSKSRDILDNPQKDFESELNGIDVELAKFDNEKTEQGQNQKPLPRGYKNLNITQLSESRDQNVTTRVLASSPKHRVLPT